MTEITHERCSELLAGHQRGELESEEASAVERHLAVCEECRAELAGLRALFAPGDFDPLRDDERRRLRAAVTEEARLTPAKVHVFPARRTFWERHAGQFVGAAASIVVVLFAYLFVSGLGGDDAGDDAGGDGGGQAGAETAEGAPAEGPLPFFASPGEVRPEADTAQDPDADEETSARSLSNFQTRQSYSEKSIMGLGESGPIFRNFMQSYSTDDVPGLPEEFLNQLASDAPEPELRDQILECGAELLGDDPERPLLPAFATVAEFKGEDSLILGLVTSDGTTTDLNRYSIWAWPVGADCNEILIGTSGAIKGP